MKNVSYNKRDIAGRGRVISIREIYQDGECRTRVMKNFLYLASRADRVPDQSPAPVIRICKRIDTIARTESFIFKIRGKMYIKEKRFIYCIDYCHSLMVRLYWKDKVLTVKPVKPAALA